MTKEELIEIIDNYDNKCENTDTWYNSDLVESALSILSKVRNYLNEN